MNIRKIIALVVVGIAMEVLALDNFLVSDVTAHQRYPWNGKVDIDFRIDCADTSADFKVTVACKDHVGNTNIVMKTLRNNDKGDVATTFVMKAGQHRLTWDADIDMPNMKLPSVSFAVTAIPAKDTSEYLIIDISGFANATNYPVSKMIGAPPDGWTNEYKTTKLVLRRCPAGADPLGRYTLTKDFYAGVFEVTQMQWQYVMGDFASRDDYHGFSSTYPVYFVSYEKIRGSSEGVNWPSSSSVDDDSFIGNLRKKTGLLGLDLPTEAQWEYACRAGTTSTYNTGDSENALANAGWYLDNATNKPTVHAVGLKTANAWGLYDMHGNVQEWCLDRHGGELTGCDPVGAKSGTSRCARGGSLTDTADIVTSSCCEGLSQDAAGRYSTGFRIFVTVP